MKKKSKKPKKPRHKLTREDLNFELFEMNSSKDGYPSSFISIDVDTGIYDWHVGSSGQLILENHPTRYTPNNAPAQWDYYEMDDVGPLLVPITEEKMNKILRLRGIS